MGRISSYYAGLPVTTRLGHVVTSSVDLPLAGAAPATAKSVQFDPRDFLHAVDKPFEVHRMTARVLYANDDAPPKYGVPDQDVALACIDISIKEKSRNVALTAGYVPLLNLIKGDAERTWEWIDPFVLVRGQGFIVQALMESSVLPFAATALRLQISFLGFLLVIPPASDNR